MPQTSLWQTTQQTNDYAEVCNALYERELSQLVHADLTTVKAMQSRLKSLPHYIKRTAYLMTQVHRQLQKHVKPPLLLDAQNAHWSAKQNKNIPVVGQELADVWQWYQSFTVPLGLVIPVLVGERILLDSIDRIDNDKQRIRGNAFGWFDVNSVQKNLFAHNDSLTPQKISLLKPNKKVMTAACAGHRWQNYQQKPQQQKPQQNQKTSSPILLTLRELLLSCGINWQNFKKTSSFS